MESEQRTAAGRRVPGRRVRTDGERSRQTILRAAADLATVDGLEGLSIGNLAAHIGMSKSGLYAHFGSKEELQLAAVETARQIFETEVVVPTETIDDPLQRVRALCDRFLSYVERRVFPGGCFFASAAAELDMQPGAVRDRVIAFVEQWRGVLERAIREAQATGSLDPSEDPAQITFEIDAAISLANAQFVVTHSPEPIKRARRAIEARLT